MDPKNEDNLYKKYVLCTIYLQYIFVEEKEWCLDQVDIIIFASNYGV